MEEHLLLREIQKGNQHSFKTLFSLYYEDLVRYAHRYVYDTSACEDIVQEVFIYIWEHKELNIQKSFTSYLYKMVQNRCYTYLKKLDLTDDEKWLELSTTLVTEVDSFDEEEKKKKYSEMLQILEAMPHQMQHIFRLKFLNDYKYLEIAEELGISVNTVKTQLKRAKEKINQLLPLISLLFWK